MFTCSDSTTEAAPGDLIDVPCDTFCITAFGSNFFLNTFSGIGDPVCQSVGCATLDSQGNFVNDVAERLGRAALGTFSVHSCDPTTFVSNPDALQVTDPSSPCNFYNPDSGDGIVDLSAQFCTNLTEVAAGGSPATWIEQNLLAFVGIVIGSIVALSCACVALWLRSRLRRGKSIRPRDAVALHEGATFGNLCGLLFIAFGTILLLAFVNAMQGFLLKDVYQVDSDDFGKITGILGVADQVVSVVVGLLWGLAADRVGRRVVLGVGLSGVIGALIWFPNGRQVFPDLLLARLLWAASSGSLTTSLSIVLADVVAPSSLGIGSGLLGLASGFGALFGVFVFLGPVATSTCITNTYYLVCIVPALMLLVTIFALPRNVTYSSPSVEAEEGLDGVPREASSSPSSRVMTSMRIWYGQVVDVSKLSWANRRLLVAYMGGFVARGCTVVISVYLPLWIAQLYATEDICGENEGDITACGEALIDPEKDACPAAYTDASRISGVVSAVTLLAALPIGMWAGHKRDSIRGLGVAALIAGIAYVSAVGISDPTETYVYGVAFLWGLGEAGLVILAQVLLTQEMSAHREQRGAIAGAFAMIGSFGILFIVYFGGLLFDSWQPQAPFFLLGLSAFILCAACAAAVRFASYSNSSQELASSKKTIAL